MQLDRCRYTRTTPPVSIPMSHILPHKPKPIVSLLYSVYTCISYSKVDCRDSLSSPQNVRAFWLGVWWRHSMSLWTDLEDPWLMSKVRNNTTNIEDSRECHLPTVSHITICTSSLNDPLMCWDAYRLKKSQKWWYILTTASSLMKMVGLTTISSQLYSSILKFSEL